MKNHHIQPPNQYPQHQLFNSENNSNSNPNTSDGQFVFRAPTPQVFISSNENTGDDNHTLLTKRGSDVRDTSTLKQLSHSAITNFNQGAHHYQGNHENVNNGLSEDGGFQPLRSGQVLKNSPRGYFYDEGEEEEEGEFEDFNKNSHHNQQAQVIQHLQLEIEDYSQRLERADQEKQQLLTLVEQFEKENLLIQDKNITLKDNIRKKEAIIVEMRKQNNRLRKIVAEGARTGKIDLEGIQNLEELEISIEGEEFESSEDSIEQRQQNQAGRLSTKFKRQTSASNSEISTGQTNVQLDEIKRALAQITSNIVAEKGDLHSLNAKHQQEIALLNQKIESLTHINDQMAQDLNILRESQLKWQLNAEQLQQKNKKYKDERIQLRDSKLAQETRITMLTSEIQKLQVQNQELQEKEVESQRVSHQQPLQQFYLGGDFANLDGSNIMESQHYRQNNDQITGDCQAVSQPRFITVGEESCEQDKVLSPIEIEKEDENRFNKLSPVKSKGLKIEIQEFTPRSGNGPPTSTLPEGFNDHQDNVLLHQILTQLQIISNQNLIKPFHAPTQKQIIKPKTPHEQAIKQVKQDFNDHVPQTQQNKKSSKSSSSESSSAQEINQGLTIFPQIALHKCQQQPSFNNISFIGQQPNNEQLTDLLSKFSKIITSNQTQVSMDLTKNHGLSHPQSNNQEVEQSMIDEFKEVLHPLSHSGKEPSVFPQPSLHQSKSQIPQPMHSEPSKLMNRAKNRSLELSFVQPQLPQQVFKAENILAPSIPQIMQQQSEEQILTNNKSQTSLHNPQSKLNISKGSHSNKVLMTQRKINLDQQHPPQPPQILRTSQIPPSSGSSVGNLMMRSSMIGNFLLTQKSQPGGIFSSSALTSPMNQFQLLMNKGQQQPGSITPQSSSSGGMLSSRRCGGSISQNKP